MASGRGDTSTPRLAITNKQLQTMNPHDLRDLNNWANHTPGYQQLARRTRRYLAGRTQHL